MSVQLRATAAKLARSSLPTLLRARAGAVDEPGYNIQAGSSRAARSPRTDEVQSVAMEWWTGGGHCQPVMNLAVPDRVQQVGAPQLIIRHLYATWARPASSLGQASAQSKYGEPHRKLAQ